MFTRLHRPGFNLVKKWYAYIELFGFAGKDSPENSIDGGFVYNVTNILSWISQPVLALQKKHRAIILPSVLRFV